MLLCDLEALRPLVEFNSVSIRALEFPVWKASEHWKASFRHMSTKED